MNLGAMMKIKQAWDTISANHPKLPDFLSTLQRKKLVEGTDVLVELTYPDGSHIKAGIKIKQSDLDALESLKSINPKE